MRPARQILSAPGAARFIFWLAIALGVALRFAAAQRGHNYDLDSYNIVAGIVQSFGNVYNETPRYNYAPIWFLLLGLYKAAVVFLHLPPAAFRGLIIASLVLVDIGIACFLRRFFTTRAAVLFMLNPVSIIITGYHNQFDNLAVLLGLWSARCFDAATRSAENRKRLLSLVTLGLSLVVKHILFFFPFWLAVKPGQKPLRRGLVLVLPIVLFLLSFGPFWFSARENILQNVFLYRSLANAPFLHAFAPWFVSGLQPMVVFLAALSVGAVVFRLRSAVESLLVYSLTVVIFAPAVTNQYLAIPAAAIAVFPNWLFAVYLLVVTLFLAADANGLHIDALHPFLPDALLVGRVGLHAYNPVIVCLFLGFVWMLIGGWLKSRLVLCWKRYGTQLVRSR